MNSMFATRSMNLVPQGLTLVCLLSAALMTHAQEAPTITTQPTNQAVVMDTDVTFSVVATGTEPLTYQWLLNGTNILADGGRITGSTSSSLTISNVQVRDAGGYLVVVSNAIGSATSQVAVLRIWIHSATLFSEDFESYASGIYLSRNYSVAKLATVWK